MMQSDMVCAYYTLEQYYVPEINVPMRHDQMFTFLQFYKLAISYIANFTHRHCSSQSPKSVKEKNLQAEMKEKSLKILKREK